METKVGKWGNSLGVRIPGEVAASAALRPGTVVTISAVGDSVVIRRAPKPRYRLADLVKAITPRNVHREVASGVPLGREVF